MKNLLAFIRAIVRPAVTFGLIAVQCSLALAMLENLESAKEASAVLAPFTMMSLTFYFKSREDAA